MRLRLVGIVAALVAGSGLVPAAAQAADPAIAGIGWWSRSPTQQAPDGGFAVAAAPDGPLTVAAVEISIGDAEVLTATLSAVETGGFGQDAASLQACLSTSEWQPEEGGAWDSAPEPACEAGSVALSRDGGARLWSAEIAPLLTDQTGSVSVMIVPGDEVRGAAPPAPPAPGVPAPPAPSSPSPAFDVRLAAPTLEAQALEPGDRSGAGDGPVITGNDDVSSGSTATTVTGRAGNLSYQAPSIEPPAAPDPDATPAGEIGEPSGGSAAGDDRALQPLSSDSDADGRPWGKALLYVLIASVMGAGAGLGRWVLREKLA